MRHPARSLAGIFLLVAVAGLDARAHAADVLLIYDTLGGSTADLVAALEAGGHTVTYSDTVEYAYDGTNPAPTGFDVVVHLNGTTYDDEMPDAGQDALVDFVEAGGGFVHHEWNAYEIDDRSRMLAMTELTLLERSSGSNGSITFTTVATMADHPVLDGVTDGFAVSFSGYNIGVARDFDTDPVSVLMRDEEGNDAVAVREWGVGRIVGFHHAGNWSDGGALANADIQRLYVNAVEWAGLGGALCTDADDDGYGSLTCGGDDCDDAAPSTHPGATDAWYDGVDADCAGNSDYDADADGQDGGAFGGIDCDDASSTTYVGAPDAWYDGVDADCAGDSDYDADADGQDSDAHGGADCVDTDATVYAGAAEVRADGVDQDCNGVDSGVDTDGDGLDDDLEVDSVGSDPFDDDSDDDGLSDGDELAGGTDPSVDDSDGDGLLDGDELAEGTDPLDDDSDDDGLSDLAERTLGTDPLDADTDHDDLSDGAEVALGTEPLVADTDGDALVDGDELGFGTDPMNADTDGGGTSDGVEVLLDETDPLDGDDDLDDTTDTDGDGLPDRMETALGTDRSDPDTDDDALADGDEVDRGTDPLAADSDGGSVDDGAEVAAGTDPLDAADDVPAEDDPTADQPTGDDEAAGCGCATSTAPGGGALLLAGLASLLGARRRARRVA